MSPGLESVTLKLPPRLAGLADLALDLRFTWSHSADVLWQQLNADLWFLTHNPWMVLQSVSRARLEKLALNDEFCSEIERLRAREKRTLVAPRWFQKTQADGALNAPIAYFSLEFGLSEALPIYSGGLGLLAGDHLKTAHDLGLPLIGVGLLYQNGYFRQSIDTNGKQLALYPANNLSELPLTPLHDKKGERVRLELVLPGRRLFIRVWQVRIGLVTLYLLDTNCPSNLPVDRCITTELYGGGPELRLQQEILLGIGGWRLLRALGIDPQVCHLNEGHAAFAVLERASDYMQNHDVDFDTALAITRAGNLFTTHTPVEAGFDRFEPQLIKRYLSGYADCGMTGNAACLDISLDKLLGLGRRDPSDDKEPFNMAYLAIRGSGAVNGVSALHEQVSRKIFAPLFSGWPLDEIPVGHVTNGVHVPSWDSRSADKLWTKACGQERWMGDLKEMPAQIKALSDEELWHLRSQNRADLVQFVRKRHARQLNLAGADMDEALERAHHQFDPGALTLGFARRFAPYKRPTLLLHDEERLAAILTNPARPVQLVIAGKAHPDDLEGQKMVQRWVRFMQRQDVRNQLMFLTDYDMHVAEQMVQGVDVWLNTPRRPWEASGTSGMKILVNGGLNLSELDGWWAEAHDNSLGWAIGDGQEHNHDPEVDAREAQEIYRLLETQIVPQFYHRNDKGLPDTWLARVRNSMAELTPRFSTNRMVRDYIETYYQPLARAFERRRGNGLTSTSLANWRKQLDGYWDTIHIPDSTFEAHNGFYELSLPLMLGELTPEDIEVQAYAEGRNAEGFETHRLTCVKQLIEEDNGWLYEGRIPNKRAFEDYTIRVIPRFEHTNIPLEAPQIKWQR